MAAVGSTATWLSALLALGAVVLGLIGASRPAMPRRWGEWALAGSAILAAVATAAMVELLLTGDVRVRYVARTITTSLAPASRAAALWQLPGGAVLPAATLAAFLGGVTASRARATLGVATVGAIVLALLAASLAASPFAMLAWVPGDGLGLDPALQHALSVVGRAALGVAIAVATAIVALATDTVVPPMQLAGEDTAAPWREQALASRLRVALLAVVGIAMWAWSGGELATGVASVSAPAPVTGAFVAPLVAAALALHTNSREGAPSLAGALGVLGLLASVLLGGTMTMSSWAARAFALVSLGACAVGAAGAWLPDATLRSSTPPRAVSAVAVIGSLGMVVGAGASAWHSAAMPPSWHDGAVAWLLVAGSAAALAPWLLDVARPEPPAPTVGVRHGMRLLVPTLVGVVAGGRLVSLSRPAAWWGGVAALAVVVSVRALFEEGPLSRRLSTTARALALACAAIAAVGAGAATSRTIDLASGARTVVPLRLGPPVSLDHQGISRYEDGNAHVAAVALEPRQAGRVVGVASPDRREYVDSREEILGPPLARPAVARFPLEELRITVESFGDDQSVRLKVSVVPFAALWGVAVALLVGSALCLLVADDRPVRRRPEVHVPISIDTPRT